MVGAHQHGCEDSQGSSQVSEFSCCRDLDDGQ